MHKTQYVTGGVIREYVWDVVVGNPKLTVKLRAYSERAAENTPKIRWWNGVSPVCLNSMERSEVPMTRDVQHDAIVAAMGHLAME